MSRMVGFTRTYGIDQETALLTYLSASSKELKEAIMRAAVYKGKNKIAVEEVPDPKIEAPGDAVIQITTAAICGSDLHMYDERSSAEKGTVFGHENQGTVAEVGKGVFSIKKGDRVVLPFNIACGVCMNCTRGFTNSCLTANPAAPTAGYGYAGMGPYRGGQAEFLRVPFADFNCLKLPGKPGDEFEDDFVLLSDIFPPGWHAAELANVKCGDSVAVFGAGPVGLLSAYSALIKGAAEVYVIDRAPDRLRRADSIGAVAIDFTAGDPVEQIKDTCQERKMQQALRPGEEKMAGVNCAIDAVGYQAVSLDDPEKEDPMQTIRQITEFDQSNRSDRVDRRLFRRRPGRRGQARQEGRIRFSDWSAVEQRRHHRSGTGAGQAIQRLSARSDHRRSREAQFHLATGSLSRAVGHTPFR